VHKLVPSLWLGTPNSGSAGKDCKRANFYTISSFVAASCGSGSAGILKTLLCNIKATSYHGSSLSAFQPEAEIPTRQAGDLARGLWQPGSKPLVPGSKPPAWNPEVPALPEGCEIKL